MPFFPNFFPNPRTDFLKIKKEEKKQNNTRYCETREKHGGKPAEVKEQEIIKGNLFILETQSTLQLNEKQARHKIPMYKLRVYKQANIFIQSVVKHTHTHDQVHTHTLVHVHTHIHTPHSQGHGKGSTKSHHRKPWPWRRQPGPQSWSAQSPAWCCAPQRECPAPAIADRCWSDTPRTGQGRCVHHSLPAVSAPRGENSWTAPWWQCTVGQKGRLTYLLLLQYY